MTKLVFILAVVFTLSAVTLAQSARWQNSYWPNFAKAEPTIGDMRVLEQDLARLAARVKALEAFVARERQQHPDPVEPK